MKLCRAGCQELLGTARVKAHKGRSHQEPFGMIYTEAGNAKDRDAEIRLHKGLAALDC